ncbi:MAG: hypothetical protein HYX22_03015 [Candidatus Yanofskybacteria bacterium]|nr:hypothetical protein [Candidatus Yanofskybacteria bacterium]
MYKGNCKCGHHWGEKILMLLVWVAGVIFFWSGLKGVPVWGYDPLFYAWSVVILSLMSFGMKHCGCCCGGSGCGNCASCDMKSGGSGKVCSHEAGCKCGDCDRCR